MLVKKKLSFQYLFSASLVLVPGGLRLGYDWLIIGRAFYERYLEITQPLSPAKLDNPLGTGRVYAGRNRLWPARKYTGTGRWR